MKNLDDIADRIRDTMVTLSATRDSAYERSRTLVGICARSIRAIQSSTTTTHIGSDRRDRPCS